MATPQLPDWDDRERREIILPFTEVKSKGGPYEDEAFTAGWQMGAFYEQLNPRTILVGTLLIYSSLVKQADLIAMHHGYTTEKLQDDGEWAQVGFTRVDE